jgi:UDP-N-acetylmuramate dehydrogenase
LLQKNVSLQSFNTFGLNVSAAFFTEVHSIKDIEQTFQSYSKPHLILGGGSNILFSQDFKGTVILNKLRGLQTIEETSSSVTIRILSGELWDSVVSYCVEKGWSGIENLSGIPGTVGAAPIQNIGAYGAELKDVFVSLSALEISTMKPVSFSLEECQFGYRSSILKKNASKYFILSIDLCLSKNFKPNLSYKQLEETIQKLNLPTITAKEIRNIVLQTRMNKLPNPKDMGNAGSFFKNPTVSISQYESLKKSFPELPVYPVNELSVKLPAAFLIEKAGWKGKVVGKAGVHKKQALVLVNYGGAEPKEIISLSKTIQADILTKFGVALETEVNII